MNWLETIFSINTYLNPSLIYPGLFVLLAINGLTTFPSSQLVYLSFGYFLSSHPHYVAGGIIAGTIGNTVGNLIMHLIVKRNQTWLYSKTLPLFSIQKEKMESFMDTVRERGSLWLVVSKLIPSVKVLVPIATGIAKMGNIKATIIFFLGSLLWAGLLTGIGYYFGDKVNLAGFFTVLLAVYFVIGLLGYKRVKRNNL